MGPQSVEEQLLTKKRLRKLCNKCAEDRVPVVSYKTPNFHSAILIIWPSLDMDLEGRSSFREMPGLTRAKSLALATTPE
jgi:hypothetical protein